MPNSNLELRSLVYVVETCSKRHFEADWISYWRWNYRRRRRPPLLSAPFVAVTRARRAAAADPLTTASASAAAFNSLTILRSLHSAISGAQCTGGGGSTQHIWAKQQKNPPKIRLKNSWNWSITLIPPAVWQISNIWPEMKIVQHRYYVERSLKSSWNDTKFITSLVDFSDLKPLCNGGSSTKAYTNFLYCESYLRSTWK